MGDIIKNCINGEKKLKKISTNPRGTGVGISPLEVHSKTSVIDKKKNH